MNEAEVVGDSGSQGARRADGLMGIGGFHLNGEEQAVVLFLSVRAGRHRIGYANLVIGSYKVAPPVGA